MLYHFGVQNYVQVNVEFNGPLEEICCNCLCWSTEETWAEIKVS